MRYYGKQQNLEIYDRYFVKKVKKEKLSDIIDFNSNLKFDPAECDDEVDETNF